MRNEIKMRIKLFAMDVDGTLRDGVYIGNLSVL